MVKRICRALKFPRSTYYKALLRVHSNREKEASTLKFEIYDIWKEKEDMVLLKSKKYYRVDKYNKK